MKAPSKDPSRISRMFSMIAPHYDLLNRILSLGIDRYWRRYAVRRLVDSGATTCLDVATGTCDIAIEIADQYRGAKIIGIDFSREMLILGNKKVQKAGYSSRINLVAGDATSMPFSDNTFDAAIIAFGIRNVNDYKTGISEMARVVKSGGMVVILEFASIQNPLFRIPYRFYITKILPVIGELISGRKGAYQYLPASMLDFPPPDEFSMIMISAGLRDVSYKKLSLGITTVHTGIVP